MILVCYLIAPGEDFALKARAFAESYRSHPAGIEHRFLTVTKDGAGIPQQCGWPATEVIWEPNDGLDIGSLQRVAAGHGDYDLIMWLGSYARILADDWLAKFHRAASLPDVGAAASSGSFEAGVSGESPNAHLRTGALMISPRLLNSLGFATAHDKRDCYEFEHGARSLYRRLRERGLRGVVVGASGRVYSEHEWVGSCTYRSPGQPELIVADGQTDAYAAAAFEEQGVLARMAGWNP